MPCRVRGVGEGLARDQPCLVQGQLFLIDQDTHQLNDSYGWVCVVQLDGYLVWELREISLVCLLEASHHVLDRGSTEEVLLLDDISLHLLWRVRILIE